ncbi:MULTISPECIES: hypothetical protein [Modicisalibacter]|uniref:hypothetical protein n=1 Tax=Modicisalibacter TaxID=574347 RepID=UPI00139682D5|nr:MULTISPECIES: hypothetical protein [Halomonadaceae]MBZ9560305.1 hypothetical protein [Modicisalibacter sp. R2A 31.J]MBZ9576214.1 hypothetical protein [Modicisalibacter sp. MOD 31.J]
MPYLNKVLSPIAAVVLSALMPLTAVAEKDERQLIDGTITGVSSYHLGQGGNAHPEREA